MRSTAIVFGIVVVACGDVTNGRDAGDASVGPDVTFDATVDTGPATLDVLVARPDAGDARTAGPDVAVMDAIGASDGGLSAGVRVVHLAARASALDLCALPVGGGTAAGPLVSRTGLAFGQSSDLRPIAFGAYDLAVVPGGSVDCSRATVPLARVTIAPGEGARTVVITTAPTNAPALVTFTDDADLTVPSDRARVRIVDAAPGLGDLDVGTLTTPFAANLAVLGTAIAFGGTAPAALLAPGTVTLAARRTGTFPGPGRYMLAAPVALVAGHAYAAYLTGRTDDLDVPPAVLVCDHTRAPVAHLAPCVLGPARASVRLAALAGRTGPVDLCYRVGGVPIDAIPVGPLFAAGGFAGGIVYPALTRTAPVAAGTPLTVLVVDAAPGDCSTPIATLATMLDAGAHVTLTLTGRSDGSQPVAVRVLTDTLDPDGAVARVRFVHALTDEASLDLVADTTALFGNVPFGTAGVSLAADPNRYLPVPPVAALLTTRRAGDHRVAIPPGSYAFRAGTLVSMFAIGNAGGTGAAAPELLACEESGVLQGVRAPCAPVSQ